ncbi:MAG: molybdopterin molybdotransferase MoeA [Syntrophaceticus sp.]|nr:molybdopterin molybdotransferase MoeA [Syntrophaceticus sp.]
MREGLFKVLPVAEAREKLAANLPVELRRSEKKLLLDCLGRRLAKSVTARENVPGFARSTVDGYAVRAQDTFGASEGLPAFFTVTGDIRMGAVPDQDLVSGEAMQIATGAMLPSGADAAVMVEYTEAAGEGSIEVLKPAGPGENVLRADEDIKAGDEVFPANHLLRSQDIGYLAALGEMELDVFVPLSVGIISTGDEIVDPTLKPNPGQVRDINSYTLFAKTLELGGKPNIYGVVQDNPQLLQERMRQAYEENDLVVISGGSSVGTKDHTAEIISSLGKPGVVFHGMAVKPGKPTLGGVVEQKPVIGLPGHPAAALIAFELLVSPLLRFGGYHELPTGIPPIDALLSRSIGSAPGREEYIFVKLHRKQGEVLAEPVLGKSGLLSPLVEADGLMRIPLESEGTAAGSIVGVYLFGTDYVL